MKTTRYQDLFKMATAKLDLVKTKGVQNRSKEAVHAWVHAHLSGENFPIIFRRRPFSVSKLSTLIQDIES